MSLYIDQDDAQGKISLRMHSSSVTIFENGNLFAEVNNMKTEGRGPECLLPQCQRFCPVCSNEY